MRIVHVHLLHCSDKQYTSTCSCHACTHGRDGFKLWVLTKLTLVNTCHKAEGKDEQAGAPVRSVQLHAGPYICRYRLP